MRDKHGEHHHGCNSRHTPPASLMQISRSCFFHLSMEQKYNVRYTARRRFAHSMFNRGYGGPNSTQLTSARPPQAVLPVVPTFTGVPESRAESSSAYISRVIQA